MAKRVRVLPSFYNQLLAACSLDQQLEIVALHLDPEGLVVTELASNWDNCGRLPSRGPEWRYVALVLDDRALCVVAACERPGDPTTAEIRDLEVRVPPDLDGP